MHKKLNEIILCEEEEKWMSSYSIKQFVALVSSTKYKDNNNENSIIY